MGEFLPTTKGDNATTTVDSTTRMIRSISVDIRKSLAYCFRNYYYCEQIRLENQRNDSQSEAIIQ